MLGIAPFAAAPFASLANDDKTVALTGIAATGAVGDITSVAFDVELPGVEAQCDVGTLAPELAIEITGVETTGEVGSVESAQELSGVESTGEVGDVTFGGVEIELTGVEGTGNVTQTFPEIEVAITGVEAIGEIGDVVATQVLDGVETVGEVGTLENGGIVVDLTGVEATVEQGEMVATQILDGVELLGEVGDLGVGDRELELTGVEATVEQGELTATQIATGDIAIGFVGTVKSELEVAITGNEATGAVGDLIPGFQIDGVFATGEVGSVALGDRELAISGVSSTTAVGTVIYSRSEAITGNQATGSVGTVEFYYVADGNVAYGQVGQLGVLHTNAILEGWGAYGWGDEPWGGTQTANETITAVGNVVGGQLLGPGVSATGQVGTVTASSTPVPDEGDVAYGQVGSVGNIHAVPLVTEDLPLGWGVGPWSGDTSSSGFYDIAWGGDQNHNPSVAYSQTGTVLANPQIPLVGVSATGQVGNVTPSHTLDPLTGVEATGQVGTVYPVFLIPITGVEATGSVGTMGVIHSNPLTGVEAVGIVGDVCPRNWTIIDTTQNASWQTIQNSQTAEWELVVTEEC